jgi:uncharacterized protein (TIGR02271 family)
MPAPSLEIVDRWRGRTVIDRDGDKVGTLSDIYLDRATNQPEWALVNTGLFGLKQTFVPLSDAAEEGDQIRVPFEKALIKDAPRVDADGELSDTEEEELYRHYGIDYGSGLDRDAAPDADRYATATSGVEVGAHERADDVAGQGVYDRELDRDVDDRATMGRDTGGPETDQAMTRSEEELRVGTARQERGRARLRKHVVTENVTTTVPVEREEVRLEREPITDANLDAATSGPAISEEEHEVVLHEERPVVDKQAVPKERVRLETDVVTDEERVSEDVRREQVDVEGDTVRDRRLDER